MTVPTLPGIEAEQVTTSRLTTRVLFAGDRTGSPVLFLHGNVSSATWWERTMLTLPDGWFGIAPDQRGYGEADPTVLTDATRGTGDLSDDAAALLDHLGITTAVVVGSSLGGSVVWRMIGDHSGRISAAVQVAPGSPFGFGATHGDAGLPTTPDFAGSGGGLINPRFLELLAERNFGTDDPFSPRNAFRATIVRPGHIADREDDLLLSMMSTHLGDRGYPGDITASPNWPFVAPGNHGASNAISPKYVEAHRTALAATIKPHVSWIRGELDLVVSDTAVGDPGVWGPAGLVPGYPGPNEYPAQPMLAQTRAWLNLYREAGGTFSEHVIHGAAHAPYIDSPTKFDGVFHASLRSVRE